MPWLTCLSIVLTHSTQKNKKPSGEKGTYMARQWMVNGKVLGSWLRRLEVQ